MSSGFSEAIPCDLNAIISKLKGNDNTVKTNGVAVRFRPVVKSVRRRHALAYALSIIQKHCFACTSVIASPLTTSAEDVALLLKDLQKENVESFDFTRLQAISLASLNRYLDTLPARCQDTTLPWLHVWESPGLRVDVSSVVNRRRRQEDRWFAVADVSQYVSTETSETSYRLPSISAFGVFDGHGGPEAAEHCSHLAPYLLYTGLWNRVRGRTNSTANVDWEAEICCTDLLTDVFFQLNQSVNEGRLNKTWNSGTTGTICLLVNDTVYTAWVGDSQCWLYYSGKQGDSANGNGPSDSTLKSPSKEQPTVNSENPGRQSAAFAVALTDRVHRPEFAPEFVSIMRSGGSVSVHISSEQDTSEESVLVFSGLGSSPCIDPTSQHLGLTRVPPLVSPHLSDCRVDAVSSVSRSIGDSSRIPSISPLPSVRVHRLRRLRPLYLVIATDGLWDTDRCSGPELTTLASGWASNASPSADAPSRQLSQLAMENGASDNITCMVVQYNKLTSGLRPHPYGTYNVCVKTRWPLGVRVASAPDNLNDYYTREVQIRGPRPTDPRWQRRVLRSQSCVGAEQLSRQTVRLSSPPR